MGFHVPPVFHNLKRPSERPKLTPQHETVLPAQEFQTHLPNPLVGITRILDVIHAPMDILDANRKLICSCRVIRFQSYELEFERLPGEIMLPIIDTGSEIYVHGYTADLRPILLKARVHTSTRMKLTVGNIANELNENNRTSFRQPLIVPAELYMEHDTQYKNQIPCMLRNISEGGACVTSDYIFEPDTKLLLKTELYPKAGIISFRSQIIRAIPNEEGMEYGLIFAQVTQQKLADLRYDLEEVREQIRQKTYT